MSSCPLRAYIPDGRRWCGISGVKVCQDEYCPPQQGDADHLVRAHRYPEEDPVQGNRGCWKGELRQRSVGGLRCGDSPLVQDQAEEPRYEGEGGDGGGGGVGGCGCGWGGGLHY